MAVVTILTLVLAALLLFLPVSQALWFLIFARDGIGSAWIVAYSVLVLLVLVVGAAGIVLLCTGGLLSQARRALAADPSGRRERRAAGSKG